MDNAGERSDARSLVRYGFSKLTLLSISIELIGYHYTFATYSCKREFAWFRGNAAE